MATGSISMATIKRYFVGGLGCLFTFFLPVVFILGQVGGRNILCENIFFGQTI